MREREINDLQENSNTTIEKQDTQAEREQMKKELLEKYGVEMWPEEKIHAFRKTLLDWFDREGRDLPWRLSQDPYRIWISEIMLQQTRVITVIPYYERFLQLFPTIQALAEAPDELLLKAWEGLGYYSRARNLKKAAQQVMEEYGGVFPSEPSEIIKLKGIGPYTAGAISSMAFGHPEPAVDGNVMRVFSRLFEIGEDIAKPATRKLFELLVRIVIDPERPGDFNQAIMDLGAGICSPVNPTPEISPIKAFNAAYQHGTMHLYPFKSKAKKPKPVDMLGLVIQSGDQFLLEQRPAEGLLANFWTFPLLEGSFAEATPTTEAAVQLSLVAEEGETYRAVPYTEGEDSVEALRQLVKEQFGLEAQEIVPHIGEAIHVFSHLRWKIQVHHILVNETVTLADNQRWVRQHDFPEYAFAVPQQKMWKVFRQYSHKFK